MTKRITAGRVACLGVVIALVGNELTSHLFREVLEITALVIAAAGLLLE